MDGRRKLACHGHKPIEVAETTNDIDYGETSMTTSNNKYIINYRKYSL